MSADGATPLACAEALARLRSDLGAAGQARWPRGATGAHAVAGCVQYAYPEIAGYWLQWASARSDVSAAHGDAVLGWLAAARRADGAWPARVGADRAEYTDTAYLYDHAILWHGLRCWAHCRTDARAGALAEAAWRAIGRFREDGRWRAAIGPAPARWSGLGGPFLLKALARLRSGEGELADAARAGIPALVEAAVSAPHREAHPQLYAIEGLLLLGERASAQAAFEALLRVHGGLAGLREEPGAGPRRFDVLAQALRVACWLARDGGASSANGEASGQSPDPRAAAGPWVRTLSGRCSPLLPGASAAEQLAALAAELTACIDNHGRIPFAPGADHCPTWTALFAEQALALHAGERIALEDLV